MSIPLITTRHILAVVTIIYFLSIFTILLGVDHYIKKYVYFKESFIARVIVAFVLYFPLSAIFALIVDPITRWLHRLVNVPYP